jgi:hypothetical protein
MKKRKIILITEKQAKMLVNKLILESKKYKGLAVNLSIYTNIYLQNRCNQHGTFGFKNRKGIVRDYAVSDASYNSNRDGMGKSSFV